MESKPECKCDSDRKSGTRRRKRNNKENERGSKMINIPYTTEDDIKKTILIVKDELKKII
jgi:hypothetical protein